MSLLLDALKRAEQEKLARQGTTAPGPTPGSASAGSSGLSLELAPVESPAQPSAPSSTAAPGERAAVQNAFAAKREAAPVAGGRSAKPWIFGGIAVALLLVAGASYFWYQVSSIGVPQRQNVAARPITPAPAAAPLGLPAPPASGDAAVPSRSDASSAPTVALPKPATPTPGAGKAPPPQAAQQLVMDLLRESGKTAVPPLKLTRSMDPPPVLAEVAAGYDALKRGDATAARRRYQAALGTDPANLDALLGLATAEARLGQHAAATRHYRRALEVDPRNAGALAGLAALADYSRPDTLEAQLRADLARYPDSSALQFTLGNLHASQSRWADAQAAYFEAHRLDPLNPDVVHNLAVSLDHLGQGRLAGEYYGKALALARGQVAQFDPRVAERRLAELRR